MTAYQLLLSKRTMKDLCRDFDLTETIRDPEISTVRGWIMDELEKRNPEMFEKWIDEGYDKSPKEYFLN